MNADMEKLGIPVIAVGIGGTLIYAGIKGYSVLGMLQNLIQGKPIGQGLSESNSLGSQSPVTGDNTAASGNTPIGQAPGDWKVNESLGQQLAAQYAWSDGIQWQALDALWNRESGWNNRAQNPSSGAYGIPQALPYSKMPQLAWPESKGGKSDPATQIRWGLTYIQGRYGDPTQAWAHEQQNGWY